MPVTGTPSTPATHPHSAADVLRSALIAGGVGITPSSA